MHARKRDGDVTYQMAYILLIFLSRFFIAFLIGALSGDETREGLARCFLFWGLIHIVTIHRNVDE